MKQLLFTLLLSGQLLLSDMSAQVCNNPVANPLSVVLVNHARFTVLTPSLIRMEWSDDGSFEDKASLVFLNRNLPTPNFKKEISGDWVTLTTEKLTLKYKQKTGKFSKENLEISFLLNGKKEVWHPGDIDQQNLLGTTRTLDGYNGNRQGWSKLPLPIEDGIISRGGWTLVQDSANLFDGNADWNWVTSRTTKEYQDWYFFGHGHDYAKAMLDYTQVAGRIPMPPRYAFGYWWCRYWSYSDSEMKELVNNMKSNNIPIDVAIIDMDWHNIDGINTRNGFNNTPKDIMGQMKGWGGYNWNKELFPAPDKLLGWMEKRSVKNALNLHPASGILTTEECYPKMVQALGLDTTKDFPYNKSFGKVSGWDTVSVGKNIPWDITNKKFAKAYFDLVVHPLEKQGVDFWWLDWQQWKDTPVKGLNNTWWLNYCFFTDMERNASKRPFLFHRWGGLGNHRYQIGFSGDTFSSWKTLDFQKYFTATAANVGYGYWSHDIGGHMLSRENPSESTSPELYTRWIQYGAFSPILRTHGTKRPETERRIWTYPYEYFVQMRKAIQLRYALLPYTYTASHRAYETGLSICLPMYYQNPEVAEAYQFGNQYYFGAEMVVSPIADSIRTANLLAPIKVWLPQGEWFDYFTGEQLAGNKVYDRNYSLAQIPVFIKSGSIIPMYPAMPNTDHLPDTLILTLIPGTKGAMTFYDDAGNNKDYLLGKNAIIKAEQSTEKNHISVKIAMPVGSYSTHVKSYRLDFCNTLPPLKVTSSGKRLNWNYNATNLTTSVVVDTVADCQIDVEFKEELTKTRALLNGVKGQLQALEEVLPKLKEALGAIDLGPMSTLVNQLSQTTTQIEYFPENTGKIVADFVTGFPLLEQEITKLRLDEKRVRPLINRLKNCYLPKPMISTLGKYAIDKPADIQILSPLKDAEIHFTTDGTTPNLQSEKYLKPLRLTEPTTLKAVVVKNGSGSEMTTAAFYFIPVKSIICNESPMPKFEGTGLPMLMDTEIGNPKENGERWLGFDKDFELTLALKKPQNLREIKVGVAQDKWTVTLPSEMEVLVSTDGKSYHSAGKINPNVVEAIDRREIFRQDLSIIMDEKEILFVKINVKTYRTMPVNHPTNAGQKAMVFVDEVRMQ